MSRIFISYRRDDSSGYAGRLYDRLSKHFGPDQIFMDIDTIEPGLDFVEVIEAAVGSCDVLIALIGKRWLSATDSGGQRRLDNPEDFVRLEIKAALDRRIRVIPALVSGAAMPNLRELPEALAMLARRNALEISDSRFHYDVDRMINGLEKVLQVTTSVPPKSKEPSPKKRAETTPPPRPKQIHPTTQSFEPELILIPAGEFLMGSDPQQDENADKDEQPQHSLYLPDYYMAKTPVTNAQYAAFVEASGHEPPSHWQNGQPLPDKQEHPVVRVSWDDAVAYCRWLSDATGKLYRLPTEAEWEKAARGTKGPIYPWGNQWDASRCNTDEGGKGSTTPVGSFPNGASPYRVLDMAGNVWEWCATKWQKPYPYDVEEDEWSGNYLEGTDVRVLRGGSWFNYQGFARCACRFSRGARPDVRLLNGGLRLVSHI